MPLPTFPVTGHCRCGAVAYELTAAPYGVYNCHCKDCQRMTGSTHSMSMPMAARDLHVLAGDLIEVDRRADSGRVVRHVLCAKCHTNIFNRPLAAPDMVVVKPGTLDDIGWAVPVGNIWTASAAPWADIDPGQVNFPGQPPDREPLYAAWRRSIGA